MKKHCLMRAAYMVFSAAFAVTAFAACGSQVEDTAQNVILQLYLGGFGTEGIERVKERFEEIYADEGYTVTVIPSAVLTDKHVADTIQLGPTITTTDLILGGGFDYRTVVVQGSSFLQDVQTDCALEDLTDLYDQKVYGEDVTLKEKMLPDFAAYNEFNGKYYAMSWNAAVTGIMYDAQRFREANEKIPYTTDELIALIGRIKERGEVPFTFTSGASYWTYCAMPWWRQFATDEEAEDFWNCIDKNGEESPEVFRSQARLQAFELVEDCIYDTTNFNGSSLRETHIEAQTRFFNRQDKIWMMPCGSWAENEMAMNGFSVGSVEIGLMPTPLSSNVLWTDIDRTDYRFATVRDDATLSKVVEAVDNGETSVMGVSPEDFAAIKKMRSYVVTEGYASAAVIPSYANAKEAAKKFLLFLASDEAHQIFYDTTKTYLPFNTTNIKTGENATQFQKDVQRIMRNASFISIYDSDDPLFFMTNMTFNSNERFMDTAIATTEQSEKLTGLGWMEWVYNDVAKNFATYQGLANAVR